MRAPRTLRATVNWFQSEMYKTLRRHSSQGKCGWDKMSAWGLLFRLKEEVAELKTAIRIAENKSNADGVEAKDYEHIVKEAIDVANLAMFVAHTAKRRRL